jgi:hypothetical protein
MITPRVVVVSDIIASDESYGSYLNLVLGYLSGLAT